MDVERIFSKRDGIYDIPCMANYLGSFEIAGDFISYVEQIAVLASIRAETKDDALQKLAFGEEPRMLTVFARSPVNRLAIEGQNRLKADIFNSNREDIPLQDIQEMVFLDGSLEII